MLPLPLLLKRTLRKWRLLAALTLGVVLGVGLLASGPLYADAVVEFGLRAALRAAPPQAAHVTLSTARVVEAADYVALDGEAQALVARRLSGWVADVYPAGNSQPVFPWVEGAPDGEQRVNFRFYEGTFGERLEVVQGQLPPAGEASGPLQAAVSEDMARNYGLTVGSRMALSRQADAGAPEAEVLVAAIVRPRDPADPYWFGEQSPLLSETTRRWKSQYGFLVDRATFFRAAAQITPGANSTFVWRILLAHERITPARLDELRGALRGLQNAAGGGPTPFTVSTDLDPLLASFVAQSTAVRAPLLLLVGQISLLILYYLLMTASLVLRQVERELSVLRSRGGSGGQIFRLQAAEAALLGGLALVAAPPAAVSFIRRLGGLGPFVDLKEAAPLSAALTLPAYLWAAAGVALCLLGLLAPVARAARRPEGRPGGSPLFAGQLAARPPGQAFWQKYYLDLFALAAGAILFWRLRSSGSLLARNLFGNLAIDPLLLLSPVLLLLGAAIVLLRLFPLFLRAAGWAFGRGRGVSLPLAVWQMARNPVHVSRLVLLLTLAFTLGLLSTSFAAALSVNLASQARYAARADLRLAAPQALRLVEQIPDGVQGATVWRGTASLRTTRTVQAEALAVDPFSLAGVIRVRADFASRPMGELLGMLAIDLPPAPAGIPLPGQPAAISLLAHAPASVEGDQLRSDLDHVRFRARVQTASGLVFSVELAPVLDPGQLAGEIAAYNALPPEAGEARQAVLDRLAWRQFGAPLPPAGNPGQPDPPRRLLALDVFGRAGPTLEPGMLNFNPQPAVTVDALALRDAAGVATVLDGFEPDTAGLWHAQAGSGERRIGLTPTAQSREGQSALRILAVFARPGDGFALSRDPEYPRPPLSAIVSPAFLAATSAAVGDTVGLYVGGVEAPVTIVGSADYFPTLYDGPDRPWLVLNAARLLDLLHRQAGSVAAPGELWLSGPGATATAPGLAPLLEAPGVSKVWDRAEIQRRLKAEPLSLGLEGVFYIGYLVTLALAVAGFGVYFYLSARARLVEFSVLRAIGLAPRQLLALLGAEQLVLILAGLLAGGGLGLGLTRLALPLVTATAAGTAAVPPFVPVVDWPALGRMTARLIGAFSLTFLAVTAILWRADILRAMKIGEE